MEETVRKYRWLPILCLAASFRLCGMETAPATEEDAEQVRAAEVIAPGKLRELLKDRQNVFGPAGELIYAMTPQEQNELRELYRNDPAAARSLILEKLEENKRIRQEAASEIQRIARLCRQSRNKAEKEELRLQLRGLLAGQFNRVSAEISVRLRLQEQRLSEVRRAYEERVANSEQMIDAQLEKMIRKAPEPRRKKEGRE